MAKYDSNDLDMPGYFLPEDSHFRLKKLRDHMGFLSRLAQPRSRDEEEAWGPQVRTVELMVCLELLADQTNLVLEEVSWPARLQPRKDASETGPQTGTARTSPANDASADADDRFAFGVTLEQIDALDRLIQTVSAHGDVMAAGNVAEPADHTLPLLGQAICDGVEAVRKILDQVEAQPLGPAPHPRTGVSEERAVYGAWLPDPVMDNSVRPATRAQVPRLSPRLPQAMTPASAIIPLATVGAASAPTRSASGGRG